MHSKLPLGQNLIHALDEKATAMLASTTAPGQPAVKDKAIAVRDRWNDAVTQMTAEESKLSASLDGWKEFSDQLKALEAWLRKTEEALNETRQPQKDLDGKQLALKLCKVCGLSIITFTNI